MLEVTDQTCLHVSSYADTLDKVNGINYINVLTILSCSSHTAIEVVSILLNKFKITDNPKSFALFEQTIQNEKEGESKLTRHVNF